MQRFWEVLISRNVMGLVALVGISLSIYLGFFYERKPELIVSVEGLSKVFDLHRPVGGLEVSYSGQNLRTSQTTLWVLTVKVKNTGNAVVHKGDYDEGAPLGLAVNGAVIAEPPTVKADTDYLKKSLQVSHLDDRVSFSPVILEAGDFFEATLLLLGPESNVPTVMPVGKVAGVKSITLLTSDSPSLEKSVWVQTIDATSIWVHLLRVPIYLIGFFITLVLLMLPVMAIITPFERLRAKRDERERKEKVRKYKPYEELSKESRYLLDIYESRGLAGLERVARYLNVYSTRRSLIEQYGDTIDREGLASIVQMMAPMHRWDEGKTEQELKDAKLVDGTGVDIRITDRFAEEFTDLCKFLELNPTTLGKPKDRHRSATHNVIIDSSFHG